jgi:acyl carrier protein
VSKGNRLKLSTIKGALHSHCPQLGVDVKRVTDEAHFTDDLGANWLDRLELMIVIEDQCADVVITDEDVDQIEVVGDLIRHIEDVDSERRRHSVVEASLK